ncbi:pollen-specific SF21-like [Micractinium conductrix]|uniref:Pollen-specific SF21-like n=1 Tax=Micractinium conductrix TaxID=554055 RepID=A0A2P6VBW2_9CHLO|nr:pollen-specific SF21-like [Micractinium conductrix]|eukprot:PSC71573.1 pollen-specific SF21-like [Micractinium conductrix]
MWSVPPREAPDERCDRLMAVYDRQIEDLEVSRPTPYWDGYCGLVKVCDEEWVRPDASLQATAAHGQQMQQQQQQQKQQQQQQQLQERRQQRQQPGSGDGIVAAPATASAAVAALGRKRLGGSVEGSSVGASTPTAVTPLSGSPIGGSPASSPFKPGPGLRQSAAMLAEQASLQLAQGQLREAESLLHAALRSCALTDTQTAGQVIDLLLEVERLEQETPKTIRDTGYLVPMGREKEQRRKGRWSLRAFVARGLRSHTLPRAKAVSDESLQASGTLSDSVPATPQSAAGAANASIEAVGAAAEAAALTAETLGSQALPAVWAGAASGLEGLEGKSLMVQVVQARRLRPADSNGLSDPYCVVKVGGHKASSKTVLKTLEPRWNETMVFAPADVVEALGEGWPHVALRVYDWDLVSADDFLGQCELLFTDILEAAATAARGSGCGGLPVPRWRALYGFDRGGQRVEAGEVQLAAWFDASASAGEQGGSALSSLCCAPGTRKQAPQVVHSRGGTLFEEPLIACLAITLESVGGVPVPALPPNHSKASFDGGDSFPASPQGSSNLRRISFEGGRRLGALFRRGSGETHGGGGVSGGGSGMSALFGKLRQAQGSHSGSVAEGSQAGDHDAGGEYDMHFMSGLEAAIDDEDVASEAGSGGGTSGGARFLNGCPTLNRRSSDRMSASPATPAGLAGVKEDAECVAPAGVGDMPLEGLSGQRLYCRLVLGRQQHTSWIRKERHNGTTCWNQMFAFAVPLPLRDRQLRIELYRTTNSTQKGRLISMAHLWLRDLVPPGAAQQPTAVHAVSAELLGALRQARGGRVQLTAALVDADQRRAMYRAPLLEDEGDAAGTAGAAGSTAGGTARPGDHGDRQLHRLESATHEYTRRELRKKALHTEEEYSDWQQTTHHRAKEAAKEAVGGLLPTASDLAQRMVEKSWQSLSSLLLSQSRKGSEDEPALPATAALLPPSLSQLPQPAGSLLLRVDCITLASLTSGDCFFVLKCGPFWARSAALSCSGGVAECGWSLSLPVLDPACLLSLAVFQQPSRADRSASPAVLRQGLRVRNAVIDAFTTTLPLVGKLRVRLSCLAPNAEARAELPLLSERDKGARTVGSVELSLQASYSGAKALVRAYTAPPLPAPAYLHGVQERSAQASMERETRRIVLRWLAGANPPIDGPLALAVLDTEREAFTMSRTKVNWRRIQAALVGVRRCKRRLDEIRTWHNPRESALAMLAILLFCFLTRLAVPCALGWAAMVTLSARPEDAGGPAPMEEDPPGIEPENESWRLAPPTRWPRCAHAWTACSGWGWWSRICWMTWHAAWSAWRRCCLAERHRAMSSSQDAQAAVSLDALLQQGETQLVETRHGPLAVTVCGDRSRTPCLTFPDVGLTHSTCWRGLLLALEGAKKSLLLRNFCFYHLDAPGCHAPGATVPPAFQPLSLSKLAEAAADVAAHFKLREVLGMGAGVGGQVLLQLAAEQPKLFCGLILISPSCRRPGWWEWGWGRIAARQLASRGWEDSTKQYLIQRMFGELLQQKVGGESDLLQAFRRECEEQPAAAVAEYLRAALARPDITAQLPRVRCRVLLLFGREALHAADCFEAASRLRKDHFAVHEVAQAGGLCIEERPADVVGVVESFCVALQLEGFGLGPQLRVGDVAARVKPGETPEQALERRIRESEAVEERVTHIYDKKDWEEQMAQAGDKLVVVEVYNEEVCQTGLEEEAELQWKQDKRAALEPCRGLKHSFARIARECQDAVFLSLEADVEEDSELCDMLGVEVLPTVQFWRSGRMLWEHRGVMKLDQDLGEGVLYYGDTAGNNVKASTFVTDLHSRADLDAFVASQPDHVLTVVNVALLSAAPCVHIFPAVLALATNFQGYAAFARLVGDDHPELLQELNIQQVPTFLFYRSGKAVGRHVGSSRADLIGQILSQQAAAGIKPPPPPSAAAAAVPRRPMRRGRFTRA